MRLTPTELEPFVMHGIKQTALGDHDTCIMVGNYNLSSLNQVIQFNGEEMQDGNPINAVRIRPHGIQ